jgi:serine protease AprX
MSRIHPTTAPSARLLAALFACLLTGLAAITLAAAPPLPQAATGSSFVIIRTEPGAVSLIEHSSVLAGGLVVRELGIINGFSALIPTRRLAAIRSLPGVLAISPNPTADFHSEYDASDDPNSMASVADAIGARGAWQQGVTGAGVDVAVLDSGVSPVAGLAAPGKIVNGPDLSIDSQTPSVRYLDGYGHGTFMAGLIAGKDSGADPSHPGSSYLGVAPDARIVNVKVGAANGAVDVSQVIAGIDWVVQHRKDNGLNIRVLSLSLGTNSNQDYRLDPLAFAAEAAWRAGIVVVAAAGNGGAAAGHLDDPAIDPFIIAVGASGTLGNDPANAIAAVFSAVGDGRRNPDLIAPGSHMQGLRVPGSFIDQRYPTAAFGDRFFRGSGTSEATAITAGAVALILQKRPWLKPSQVKLILTRSAAELRNADSQSSGSGLLRVLPMVADQLRITNLWQALSPSIGTGSLELARGDAHVAINGVALTGEQDIFGHAFSGGQMALLEVLGQSWSGGTWNGTTWSGTTWSGTSWNGTTWSGTTWSGTTWSGTTWSGAVWNGTTWSGTTWSGTTWSGTTWSGTTWSDGTWAADSWS